MCLWPRVGFFFALFILVCPLVCPAAAQSQEDSMRIYTEHPRLFLGQHRLKLLQKEKERRAPRRQAFGLLVAGPPPQPQPGVSSPLSLPAAGAQPAGPAAGSLCLAEGGGGTPRLYV